MNTASDHKDRPQLKFADNVPVKVQLETQPDSVKVRESSGVNKTTGKPFTSPYYLYFVTATDPFTSVEGQYVWFAKDFQHKELLARGAMLGGTYEMTNRKMPGEKYPSFIVRDVASVATTQSTSDDLPPLEEYLKDPQAGQVVGSVNSNAINANKTQAPVPQRKDGQTMGMCFKIACDWADTGGDNFNYDVIKGSTKKLYGIFQELMSE